MSDDSSAFKRLLILAMLALIAAVVLFWRDGRQRFAELSARTSHDAHAGGIDEIAFNAAQGASIGPVDVSASAAGFIVADLRESSVGRATVLTFRLRATRRGQAYPALAIVLKSAAGQALRTLLFTPTVYAHGASPGDEFVQLRVMPRAGEVRVTVRAVNAALLPIAMPAEPIEGRS